MENREKELVELTENAVNLFANMSIEERINMMEGELMDNFLKGMELSAELCSDETKKKIRSLVGRQKRLVAECTQ